MRLVTFVVPDGRRLLGAMAGADASVIDLQRAQELVSGENLPALTSMQALIESGPAQWRRTRELIASAPEEAHHAAAAVRLLAPLPEPVQMRDFASFEAHSSDGGRINLPAVWYEQPVYYKCNRFSVVGPDATVIWPASSNLADYELELAAIVGLSGKDVQKPRAHEHIFGYTIFNDLSARDWQFREMECRLGPARGKDFDGGNVLGPCIVTTDEIPDPYSLRMLARVNGEIWSCNSSATIYHRFDAMIAFASEGQTLHAGEVLGSGTVGGGCGVELGRYLSRGDVIELEIERIGTLRTRIA